MKFNIVYVISLVCSLMLSGCNTKIRQNLGLQSPQQATVVLTAQGHANIDSSAQLTASQARFKAERMAKMMAYRQLFAQLVQYPLPDSATKIGEKIVKNEAFRLYLDAYLREAKTLQMHAQNKHLLATLQLEISPKFLQCIAGDVTYVSACLHTDNKLVFSRLGFQAAEHRQVSMSCRQSDCASLYHTGGFDKRINIIDRSLLNAGLMDLQWKLNTAGRLFVNYEVLKGVP